MVMKVTKILYTRYEFEFINLQLKFNPKNSLKMLLIWQRLLLILSQIITCQLYFVFFLMLDINRWGCIHNHIFHGVKSGDLVGHEII